MDGTKKNKNSLKDLEKILNLLESDKMKFELAMQALWKGGLSADERVTVINTVIIPYVDKGGDVVLDIGGYRVFNCEDPNEVINLAIEAGRSEKVVEWLVNYSKFTPRDFGRPEYFCAASALSREVDVCRKIGDGGIERTITLMGDMDYVWNLAEKHDYVSYQTRNLKEAQPTIGDFGEIFRFASEKGYNKERVVEILERGSVDVALEAVESLGDKKFLLDFTERNKLYERAAQVALELGDYKKALDNYLRAKHSSPNAGFAWEIVEKSKDEGLQAFLIEKIYENQRYFKRTACLASFLGNEKLADMYKKLGVHKFLL